MQSPRIVRLTVAYATLSALTSRGRRTRLSSSVSVMVRFRGARFLSVMPFPRGGFEDPRTARYHSIRASATRGLAGYPNISGDARQHEGAAG